MKIAIRKIDLIDNPRAAAYNRVKTGEDAEYIFVTHEDYQRIRHGKKVKPVVKQNLTTRTPAKVEDCELEPFGPGAALHGLIFRLTGETFHAGCGCCKFAKRMDEWGYAGCLWHLTEIKQKLFTEARRRGYNPTYATWLELFKVLLTGKNENDQTQK